MSLLSDLCPFLQNCSPPRFDTKLCHCFNKHYCLWLKEFVIDGEWLTTGGNSPKPFLIYDNGPEHRDRVIVFGTEDGLRHLAKSQRWFMDGNFAMAPNIFTQLYVIRAPLGDSAVTCTYALLSGKSQAIYETMFRGIEAKCEELGFNLDPLAVVADFELVSILK